MSTCILDDVEDNPEGRRITGGMQEVQGIPPPYGSIKQSALKVTVEERI